MDGEQTAEIPERGVAVIERVVATLPLTPGVYRMLDGKGEALYVGKAKSLRKRVYSYTQIARLPERLRRMVSETVTMEIVRPALSGAVIALVTRREAGDRVALLGDTLIEDAEGDILLNSLGSLTEDAGQGSGGRRRTLRAGAGVNFRALVKGERLATKPGRADDFSWPKPEPPPLVPAAAPAAGAKAATDAQRPAAAKARARGQNQN